jgi:hypothetical protein
MATPEPGDWPPPPHRLTAMPVRQPDPASQPPYYLNGYEHEHPAGPSAAIKPGTGDPWDPAQSLAAAKSFAAAQSFAAAESPTTQYPATRHSRDPLATGTRTLWMIAVAFAAVLTLFLAIR